MKSLKAVFRNLFNTISTALFPSHCICCEEVIDENEFLCDYCYELIERIDASKRCLCCGFEKENCECKRVLFHFEGCVMPFYNMGIAQKALYKFKLASKEYYDEFFAREMAKSIKSEMPDVKFDCVVSTPMRFFKKLRRGYNHSELLARKISKILGVPMLNNALYCKRASKGQHNLDGRQRFLNVRGLYGYKYKHIGKTVLLVDDIRTTGATLDECARQLLFAGAHRVYCVAALATPLKKKISEKDKDNNGNRNWN